MKRAILLGSQTQLDRVYGPKQRERLSALVNLEEYTGAFRDLEALGKALKDAELIFTTWGMKRLDETFLSMAPKLEAVFYAAGSVRGLVTPAFWDSGVRLMSAWAANAVPVAEFSFSLIILGLKRFFAHASAYKSPQGYRKLPAPGAFGSVVGLVGMGRIGRGVRELLRMTNVEVVAYDPFLSPAEADRLGVELANLDELFAKSDVVSLHAPNLPTTRHMIGAAQFQLMKEGAVFINTARGALVDEAGLAQVFADRKDLWALLDVTDPEPPTPDSPLYALDNVVLTPHIAGSQDRECYRMAEYMIDECQRYLQGEPLLYQVTPEMMETMA